MDRTIKRHFFPRIQGGVTQGTRLGKKRLEERAGAIKTTSILRPKKTIHDGHADRLSVGERTLEKVGEEHHLSCFSSLSCDCLF
jgi:hypothetical protein